MKRMLSTVFFISCFAVATAHAVPQVGGDAPDFSVKDANGKTQKLSEQKGKFVVLEWYNQDCPFVRKHYDVNNMQDLQKTYTGKGVVWYTISSSKKGKEGFLTADAAKAQVTKEKAVPTAFLLDADGAVGKAYAAKTTPHMFVIDPKGKVVYMGAIDDKASADSADIKTSQNYVKAALDEAMASKPVTLASSKPYGCSVKY